MKQNSDNPTDKELLKRAIDLIEHFGWTSSESPEVIRNAEKWIKDYDRRLFSKDSE